MNLIDGTAIAATIRRELTEVIANIKGRRPRLDVILVGNDLPSAIYVERKQRACSEVGIESFLHSFDSQIGEKHLLNFLASLNQNPDVDGILVQLPLPSHIDVNTFMASIEPEKDVDGFHPINRGKLLIGDPTAFVPCTPLGICELLKRYQIPTEGRRVTIVGRSNLVGKPLAILLMQNAPWANATVTVAHSLSIDLEKICREADILVSAVGKPRLIGPHMVKEGATVIDVGTSMAPDSTTSGKRRIIGDVDFPAVSPKCQWITPVPGGVGPMTIAMLLFNTYKSYSQKSVSP